MRPIVESDRPAVLPIARELVRSGDTYAFDPSISDEDLWGYWSPSSGVGSAAAGGHGFVAEVDGEVAAMFVIRPNHPGPGSHVANASYAVRADLRGRGVGRGVAEESLGLAAGLGYSAMQFNIVISTNTAAVRLWQSLGFDIVGTIPDGFRMPDGRFVDHHIMYRRLDRQLPS